jgi:hypothetical protein
LHASAFAGRRRTPPGTQVPPDGAFDDAGAIDCSTHRRGRIMGTTAAAIAADRFFDERTSYRFVAPWSATELRNRGARAE